jgi:hypothetical protein
MTVDLTDFRNITPITGLSGKPITPVASHEETSEPTPVETPVEKTRIDENTILVGDHTVKIRGSVSKQQFQQTGWEIDKFTKDGQLVPLPDDGKVASNTEVIPKGQNSL